MSKLGFIVGAIVVAIIASIIAYIVLFKTTAKEVLQASLIASGQPEISGQPETPPSTPKPGACRNQLDQPIECPPQYVDVLPLMPDILNRQFQGIDTGLIAISTRDLPYDKPVIPVAIQPMSYKGELVQLAVMPQGDIMPIVSTKNTSVVNQDIMQGQIDILKAGWADAAKSFVAPTGRNITEAQLRAGDIRSGDIYTVNVGGRIAPMQYDSGKGDWYLALPYNAETSTPMLEYNARNIINLIRPTAARMAQQEEAWRLIQENM
jgi:hypothetical protein